MYVDKPLMGVNAVQTLSRLNRAYPGKEETFVLDFVNDSESILEAFEPFYEETAATPTDPNVLFDAADKVLSFKVIEPADLTGFAQRYYDVAKRHAALAAGTQAAYDRARNLSEEKLDEFRDTLDRFTRFYAFLSQVLTYVPPETENLYVFSKALRARLLEDFGGGPGVSLAGLINLSHYKLKKTGEGSIELKGNADPLDAYLGDGTGRRVDPDLLPKSLLSELVELFNSRFGSELTDADMVGPVTQIIEKIAEDPALPAQARANSFDDFRRGKEQTFIGATLDVKDVNDKVLPTLLDDPDLLSRATEIAMRTLFEQFRLEAKDPE